VIQPEFVEFALTFKGSILNGDQSGESKQGKTKRRKKKKTKQIWLDNNKRKKKEKRFYLICSGGGRVCVYLL
jgi:hypothetical protein